MLFRFEITADLVGVAMVSTDGSVVTVHLAFDAKPVEGSPKYKIMFSHDDWSSGRTREAVCEDAARIAVAHFAASLNKPTAPLHFTATADMGRWPGRLVPG